MTCAEVREYLFAFLDNELDAPLSIELQRHLERCHDCARETEIERTIRKQLEELSDAGAAEVPALNESSGGLFPLDQGVMLKGPVRLETMARRGSLLATAAAVLLVIGGATWFVLPKNKTSHAGGRFPDLVISDLEHFLETGKPLQIASTDPGSVATWLHQQTNLPIALPAENDPRYKLVGGRKCKIGGRPAAFAMYEVRGVPASLVVVSGGDAELDGMERVRESGRTHWVDRCKGHTVVACRRGPLVYAVVSRLPEDELLFLMEEMKHEGD